MPTISPDYSKNHELNLIEYESGKKYGRNKTGSLGLTSSQHNGNKQHGEGTINHYHFLIINIPFYTIPLCYFCK